MDRKVAPVILEMINRGLGVKRIADQLNDDEVPYYQPLPIKFRFYPRTPKRVLDSFRSLIKRKGKKYAFKHVLTDASEDVDHYYRFRLKPAPWTVKKVRSLCLRMGITPLSALAYGKIASIHQREKDRAEYLKREWGSRASKVIDYERGVMNRELRRWWNERRNADPDEEVIERFVQEARRRGASG